MPRKPRRVGRRGRHGRRRRRACLRPGFAEGPGRLREEERGGPLLGGLAWFQLLHDSCREAPQLLEHEAFLQRNVRIDVHRCWRGLRRRPDLQWQELAAGTVDHSFAGPAALCRRRHRLLFASVDFVCALVHARCCGDCQRGSSERGAKQRGRCPSGQLRGWGSRRGQQVSLLNRRSRRFFRERRRLRTTRRARDWLQRLPGERAQRWREQPSDGQRTTTRLRLRAPRADVSTVLLRHDAAVGGGVARSRGFVAADDAASRRAR
mmetsp:Transcript_1740/g.5142  ORF Transcript_1740/g.5142 Transcript_1740/m.5142 type:complete len:264 (+) Transcript_1740:153-944(+)